jgi:hypothetical protein
MSFDVNAGPLQSWQGANPHIPTTSSLAGPATANSSLCSHLSTCCKTPAQGLQPFEGHELATGETSTRGLETLAAFAAESAKAGARFAKWRAVLRIDEAKG